MSSDGNISLSTLSFVPTRAHHNSVLACRAKNELVKHGTKETFVKLNVFCKYTGERTVSQEELQGAVPVQSVSQSVSGLAVGTADFHYKLATLLFIVLNPLTPPPSLSD